MLSTVLTGGLALLIATALGVLVHESLHALVLRASGVRCSLVVRPDSPHAAGLDGLVSASWASVELESIPPECPAWRLRLAAVAPFAMLVPVGAYALLASSAAVTDSVVASMVVVGWMACALPSPADFSIFWHPGEVRASLSGE